MDGSEYDVVICGTGFIESILSGLLSLEGKRVLHIDRNGYYGDEAASLNLTSLWKKFRGGDEPPQVLGKNRDWNVDLIPKFIMASGKLVKMLLVTKVSSYLSWKPVDATYVYQYVKGGIFSGPSSRVEKVPSTAKEALKSDLMGILEKRRCKKFLDYVDSLDLANVETWKNRDIRKMSFQALVDKFSLGKNTIEFIMHAVALYTNDDKLGAPAIDTINRIKLYLDSQGRFGSTPFIYPVYGLGGIPEGFSRKCAVGGGTFMLNQDITEMRFGDDGKVASVHNGPDMSAKTTMVIANPYYLMNTGQADKVRPVGKVIRCICLLDKQVACLKDKSSAQIIIPQGQTGRKSDIYVMVVGHEHQACMNGFHLAIVSATVETNDPESELEIAFNIIGSPIEKFVTVSTMYEPTTNGLEDNVFVTNTLDPTSNFESAANDVLRIYRTIMGKELDLENIPEDEDY